MEAIDKNQTIDETKRKLKASREQLEGEIEVQLQDVKKDATEFGKQILLIGGGIYLSYRLLKALTSNKDKKKQQKKQKKSKQKGKGLGIGKMLTHQLLTMAVVAITDQVKDSFQKNQSVNDRNKHS